MLKELSEFQGILEDLSKETTSMKAYLEVLRTSNVQTAPYEFRFLLREITRIHSLTFHSQKILMSQFPIQLLDKS